MTNKMPKGAGKSSFELIDTDKLFENLPVKRGAVIMDLACGKGAYTLHMSPIVGEEGLIYAVDLWEEGILLINEEIEKGNIGNISPIRADASLPGQIAIDEFSTDMCLMATVLHDFAEAGQTDAVLKNVKNLLKPGGCLAIVEFKKMDGPPGPPIHIRLTEDEVEKILTPYGFKKQQITDIGPYNYLMTFRVP